MIKQGIKASDISYYLDEKQQGNLTACMNAFLQVGDEDGGTWHLQDDVIISSTFKQQTEQYDDGIVCGFASKYDSKEHLPGKVNVKDMWFSFPCIRIPNKIAKECAEWTLECIIGNPVYKTWWEKGVHDDMIFRRFVWEKYENETAVNLAPNVVNHIDYLVGGSVNGRAREKKVLARYWNENKLLQQLESELIKCQHSAQ